MAKRGLNPAARNPLSGNEFYVRKASQILQNTLEQIILLILNILIFTIVSDDKRLFILPFCVFFFTIGRIAFGIGYLFHPKYRIVGMVWTCLPWCLLLICSFAKIYLDIDLFIMFDYVLG